MPLLRNVVGQNLARAVSDDVSLDLPVNPLLLILYTLRCEQLAGSGVADQIVGLGDVLGDVTRLEVLFRGTALISGSLTDLAVVNGVMAGRLPVVIGQGDATGGARAVTVPIWLGRPWLNGAEAFPAVRRGELTLHRVFAGAFTRQVATTVTEQIETLEVLGGEPTSFLKYVTLSRSFVTTGDNDVDLPLGNPITKVVLFGTTPFNATVSVATWRQTKCLVDNVEYQYALVNWETLHGELNRRLPLQSDFGAHTHTENLAVAYAADVATAKVRSIEGILANYALLDFDTWDDGKNLLETAGRGRVHLRVTAGTADAARALPIEVVALGGGAAA